MKVRAAVTVLSLALMLPLAVPLPADARSRVPAQVLAQAEMSLRVQGTITIEADGTVGTFDLPPARPITPELAAFVHEQVGNWRFEPMPQAQQMPVALRLISRPDADGQGMTVRIAAAHFGDDQDVPATQRLLPQNTTPPRYPRDVYEVGGTGTVLLLLKIGPDGKVIDAGVRQVNLTRAGSEPAMRRIRDRLAQVSLEAARKWTYQVPSEGPEAGQPYWLANMPVTFDIDAPRRSADSNGWEAYLPGPRLEIAWAQDRADASAALEAMPEDRPTLLGSANPAPVLKTPLGG